jgi:hypothetical protein
MEQSNTHALSIDTHHDSIESPTQTSTGNTGSPFLDKFPLEIRNEVYKHMLCNPILAEPTFVQRTDKWCLSWPHYVAYDLSPAILQTCRQIYEEASIVLYERNTFYLICRE